MYKYEIDMALIVLDKCIIQPSKENNELKAISRYKEFQERNEFPEPIKTVSFVYDREKKENNIDIDRAGDSFSCSSKPVYDEDCNCRNNRHHELYNFEFVADSFYDADLAKSTRKRLKHPLQLMVSLVILLILISRIR